MRIDLDNCYRFEIAMGNNARLLDLTITSGYRY